MKVSTGFTNKERFIEDPDGEWVKYSDTEELREGNKRLKDRVNYLNDIIRAYRKGMFPVQRADIDKKIIPGGIK